MTAAGSKAELHLYHDHMHELAALPSMTAAVQAEIGLFLNRAVVEPNSNGRKTWRLIRLPGPAVLAHESQKRAKLHR